MGFKVLSKAFWGTNFGNGDNFAPHTRQLKIDVFLIEKQKRF